jgi:hypothetical protein
MRGIQVLERLLLLVVSLESHREWVRWEWVVQELLLQRNLSRQVLDQLF